MADHFYRTHQFNCGCKLDILVQYEEGRIFFGGGWFAFCDQHLANRTLVRDLQEQVAALEAERDRLKSEVSDLLERERLERARRFALEENLENLKGELHR